MRQRKGFYRIAAQRLARGDLGWLARQARKYLTVRNAVRRGDGKIATGPIIVHLFSTNRCDSRCVMCDLPSRPAAYEFTTADFEDLLVQFVELGVTGISFTGGEPTLREDIHQLLTLSAAADLDTILVTNGLTLDRHIDQLVELDLNTVNVSLESSDPAVHDRIRGIPGAFARTTGNIRQLLAEIRKAKGRTEIVISTVLGPDNTAREEIDRLLEYVNGMGIRRVIICPLHDFDCRYQAVGIRGLSLDYDLSRHLLSHPRRSIIDNSDWYLQQLDAVLQGRRPPAGCVAGYTTLFIDWELKVYPCKAFLEIQKPIADLRASGRKLSDVWHSEEYRAFRRFCPGCSQCFLSANREFDGVFR